MNKQTYETYYVINENKPLNAEFYFSNYYKLVFNTKSNKGIADINLYDNKGNWLIKYELQYAFNNEKYNIIIPYRDNINNTYSEYIINILVNK